MNESNTAFISPAATTAPSKPLQDCVDEHVATYFAQLDNAPATNVYEMVLAEVEIPLMKRVLKHTRGNQSKAAIVLGLSRGTLRKKLKMYGMEGRIKEVIAE